MTHVCALLTSLLLQLTSELITEHVQSHWRIQERAISSMAPHPACQWDFDPSREKNKFCVGWWTVGN